MSAPALIDSPSSSLQNEIIGLTQRACLETSRALELTIDALHSPETMQLEKIAQCEHTLDDLDRELDQKIATALAGCDASQVPELLLCVKFMIDLERIGDLLLSFAARIRAVGTRLSMTDLKELLTMGSVLQKMLVDAYQAFSLRDLDRAISVLRADAEIDRCRNLIFFRHVENREDMANECSVHVLFMAQALERAGDHTKNLAEEVCHLVSGHSVRHAKQQPKADEQMYLDYLRHQAESRETAE
jgi:phosphate transport system protein